jgi:SPX domain protein involved in polyphosphate accumulation
MYRYELKLITDERNTINILNWLFKNSSIKKKYNNRFVNSIYFDTPKYKFAKENIIGLSKRKKIRIRWYGRSNNDFHSPVLEIKNKIGRLGEKVNISIKNKIIFNQNIKYNDLTKLLYNNFDILTKINFYPNLHPTLKVNYIREYYETTKNIRVTVDRNINFYKTESNFKIFRNDN